ncbi:MAG TPA: plastocyanin/azurin family copper-binding protein [Candidatus Limnocylindrales bacterium]|nr:plastocyanin/azurin family copper-binding protein [Candidatus Limnocylindrales bacterium]
MNGRARAAAGLAFGVGIAIATGLGASAVARSNDPIVIPITIHWSHYDPSSITVPVGRAVTFEITNADPIDHEWIVGDAALHERHRTGTEPVHNSRPTEITIPALSERRTTVTFTARGSLQFICHLPGHEAYGMVGTVTITPG